MSADKCQDKIVEGFTYIWLAKLSGSVHRQQQASIVHGCAIPDWALALQEALRRRIMAAACIGYTKLSDVKHSICSVCTVQA